MLATLGLPVAQREAAAMTDIERTLQGAVDALASQDAQDDAQAFATLARLAAEHEDGAARTRYGLSATRAYHGVVEQGLAGLREQRIEGMQTLSGFMSRRVAPAMQFCNGANRRLTCIADRINRAVSVTRVRVGVVGAAVLPVIAGAAWFIHRLPKHLALP